MPLVQDSLKVIGILSKKNLIYHIIELFTNRKNLRETIQMLMIRDDNHILIQGRFDSIRFEFEKKKFDFDPIKLIRVQVRCKRRVKFDLTSNLI